jgi:thioredoxin-dependent peroxiredoxin
MRTPISRALALAAIALAPIALAPIALAAQSTSSTTTTTTTTTTTVVGPAVGDVAPDFTLPWADATGPRATPVALKDLRGKVVVLAYYPKDRTSGCTAELTKFRDEYATLFGDGVVVVPVSADSLTSHTAWAQEMKFPFALASDLDLSVADKYASRTAGRPASGRTVYVIGKDGRVVYRELRFNALSEDAYKALADAVKAARGS